MILLFLLTIPNRLVRSTDAYLVNENRVSV